MKQSLILISFLVVFFIESKNTIYEIKEGDTLYSIAKENNISINKIFLANNTLGFSPDKIFTGNTILIPVNKVSNFEKICFSKLGLYQVHFFKPPNEVASECILKLSKLIDIDNINPVDIKYEEILYLVNKIYLDVNPQFQKPIDWSIPNSKESEILISAAMNGDIRAVYSALEILPGDFSDYINDSNLLQIRDHSIDFADRKNSCNSFNSELDYENYDLLLYFYLECADTFFDEGDNDYIKFDNLLIDLIFNNDSKITKLFELYAVTNIGYRRLNTNDDFLAFDITNNFINLRCPDCENSLEFYNKYISAKYIENPLYYHYSDYLNPAFYYFVLNDTSAYFTVNGSPPSTIEWQRGGILDIIKTNIETDDPNNIYGIKDSITAIESDTALLLMQWSKCDIASKYLDSAIKNYSSGTYDNSNHDYFIEPLYLSACYIGQALSTDVKNIEIAQGYYDKARTYKNISIQAMYELDIRNPLKLSLLSLINLFLDYEHVNDEQNISETNMEYQEAFINLSNILKDPDIYNFSGDIETYELITGLYTNLYYVSDLFNWVDTNLIIDPVTLIGMKSRFYITSKLMNLKVRNTNSSLVNLQSELKNNNKKINDSSNNKIDYLEMLKLYKDNSMLIEKIFTLNDNLKKLTSPESQTISSISESLKSDEFAYFLIPSSISSKILLISADKYEYWSIPSYAVLKPMIDSFISLNMSPGADYDFKQAKLLGDYLFPMLQDSSQGIKVDKGSTILIHTDNLLGVPPGVFVKSYNQSDSISEYERLITADWLIKDYNFTTRLNYENKSIRNNTKPFLGIGNSTSYEWVGLPNLKEVNSEITNLAITSLASKDDILLKAEATKEYFLDKLHQNYSRIVISTHSVPANWQGLIEEPALVFNSEIGDYFLTPSEIININFNSEMVVLSSCNASINGFDDLYKSFLIAGSQSVVHSNWNLESKYAKNFTTSFFKELWLNEGNKHEAIRNVSIDFLNDYSNQIYAHPAYWGNFSIVYSN